MRYALATLFLSVCFAASKTETKPSAVSLQRVPDGGLQQQVAVDEKGVIHMIFFRGEAISGDVFYVRSADGGAAFTKPIQVNHTPGSAIAAGTVRGPQLAVGRNGRVHVAWNGSRAAEPKGPSGLAPMLYTRLNDAGTAFEPERNVIQSAYGVDGGGSVAADRAGNVYVVWHAPAAGEQGEGARRVWVAHSADDGSAFQPEKAAFDEPTGACGCCGLSAFADSRGAVFVLYRSAFNLLNRDMYLLFSRDFDRHFEGAKIDTWNIGACVMSTQAFAEGPDAVFTAWETKGQVHMGRIDPKSGKVTRTIAAPGESVTRKHPALATNARGDVLLAWTEGAGWKKGGSLGWHVFDKSGSPKGEAGHAEGVAIWGLVSAYARPDGGFTVVY